MVSIAAALSGAQVTATDIGEVLSLLKKNVMRNLPPSIGSQAHDLLEGSCNVLEFDWCKPPSASLLASEYDLIICADCVDVCVPWFRAAPEIRT